MGIIGDYKSFNKNEEKAGLYGQGSVPKSHVSGNGAGRELLNFFTNGGTIFDSDVSDKTAPKALAQVGKTIVQSDKLNWFQYSGFDKK